MLWIRWLYLDHLSSSPVLETPYNSNVSVSRYMPTSRCLHTTARALLFVLLNSAVCHVKLVPTQRLQHLFVPLEQTSAHPLKIFLVVLVELLLISCHHTFNCTISRAVAWRSRSIYCKLSIGCADCPSSFNLSGEANKRGNIGISPPWVVRWPRSRRRQSFFFRIFSLYVPSNFIQIVDFCSSTPGNIVLCVEHSHILFARYLRLMMHGLREMCVFNNVLYVESDNTIQGARLIVLASCCKLKHATSKATIKQMS